METMRDSCHRCGSQQGELRQGDMHVGLYCASCGAWQRWISKRDAGVERRSMATRRGISPSLRRRVFARDGHRCVQCGAAAPDVPLVVGHIVSVADLLSLGADDATIYDYWNLCCMCEECNAGLGAASLPLPNALRIYHRALLVERWQRDAS